MTGRVGIDTPGRVATAVVEGFGPEREDGLMGAVQVVDPYVEVELLLGRAPDGRPVIGHALEGEDGTAVAAQHGGPFADGPPGFGALHLAADQLSVELGEFPGIRAVQNEAPQTPDHTEAPSASTYGMERTRAGTAETALPRVKFGPRPVERDETERGVVMPTTLPGSRTTRYPYRYSARREPSGKAGRDLGRAGSPGRASQPSRTSHTQG